MLHQTGPRLGLLGWRFLAPAFHRGNPAMVRPQPDNLRSQLLQISRGTVYFFMLSFNIILLPPPSVGRHVCLFAVSRGSSPPRQAAPALGGQLLTEVGRSTR